MESAGGKSQAQFVILDNMLLLCMFYENPGITHFVPFYVECFLTFGISELC